MPLGDNVPDKVIKKTAKQKKVKTEKQQEIDKEKVTYWLDPELVKKLHHLKADTRKKLSNLVAEALEDLFKKYQKKAKTE